MGSSEAVQSPLLEPDIPGTRILRGRADGAVLRATRAVMELAPPRRYVTAWGRPMSVAMTNCGELGWYSDRAGYRYTTGDPVTGKTWPAMPGVLRLLAVSAAAECGYRGFEPEACLINLYAADARMGMHQDRDERALDQPVVSVSFGRAAIFRFGGPARGDPARTMLLEHGDILVFGGPARLCYHGVTRLAGPPHAELGIERINLTFRRVRS